MRRNIYDRLSERRIRDQQRLERELAEQQALQAPIKAAERFHANELSFVRPAGARDDTFHVLTLTDTGPSPLSVVLGRTPIEADQRLENLAQQLVAHLSEALLHLQWIEPLCPAEVAGMDARRVEFRWHQEGQPMHQLQLLFLHQDEHQHRLLMQITATGKGPEGITAQGRAAFQSILDTLELRGSPAQVNPAACL